jgi:hypothetical protein
VILFLCHQFNRFNSIGSYFLTILKFCEVFILVTPALNYYCVLFHFHISMYQVELALRFNIKKYPTLKMFRSGEPVKREYRGQRSVASLTDFVRLQLKDPVVHLTNVGEIQGLNVCKPMHCKFYYHIISPCVMTIIAVRSCYFNVCWKNVRNFSFTVYLWHVVNMF